MTRPTRLRSLTSLLLAALANQVDDNGDPTIPVEQQDSAMDTLRAAVASRATALAGVSLAGVTDAATASAAQLLMRDMAASDTLTSLIGEHAPDSATDEGRLYGQLASAQTEIAATIAWLPAHPELVPLIQARIDILRTV